jgi:hypothetical protein
MPRNKVEAKVDSHGNNKALIVGWKENLKAETKEMSQAAWNERARDAALSSAFSLFDSIRAFCSSEI